MSHDFITCDQHGRMPGDQRRELILATAFDLFSRRGFSGTTTKDIAKASGVSEAMLYKHFSTKEELYVAILDEKKCSQSRHQFPWEENENLIKAMDENDDFGVLYHFAARALEKQQHDVAFMRMIFYSALEGHEMADRFFKEFVSAIYDFLGAYIRRRQADGAFKPMDPKIVVRAFLGMLIHHSLNNILWDKRRELLDITNEEAARHFAGLILKGTVAEEAAD